MDIVDRHSNGGVGVSEAAIANTSCMGGLLLYSVMLTKLRLASQVSLLFTVFPVSLSQHPQVRFEWKSNRLPKQRQNYYEAGESRFRGL